MSAAPANDAATVPTGGGPRSIDDLIATVSASRLSTWQQCRLKFMFRYVLGLKKPKSPALHVGSTVHSVLRYWNLARWKGEHPTLKQLHDVYSTQWCEHQQQEPVEWQGDQDEEKKTGWRLLETVFRESPIPADERPEAVEVSVEADLAGHGLPKLVGILDLVRAGGRIVDFKSSAKTPDPAQVAHLLDTQTTAYSILYRESNGRAETAIELHHLVKTKSPKLVVTVLDPATDAQVTRLFRVIGSYVSGLERKDFVPSPGLQCAACEFFAACRAWG
jgi:CRISPR/Cas system-associated exonuclease Cas4 (RecB family)